MHWVIHSCEDFQKRLKKFGKEPSWKQEVANIGDNLDTLFKSLNDGIKPTQLKAHSFVHGNYELGILSIDESGPRGKQKPKALRLYVFPHEPSKKLYVMILGDKSTQPDDVRLSKGFVSGLLERDEHSGQ